MTPVISGIGHLYRTEDSRSWFKSTSWAEPQWLDLIMSVEYPIKLMRTGVQQTRFATSPLIELGILLPPIRTNHEIMSPDLRKKRSYTLEGLKLIRRTLSAVTKDIKYGSTSL